MVSSEKKNACSYWYLAWINMYCLYCLHLIHSEISLERLNPSNSQVGGCARSMCGCVSLMYINISLSYGDSVRVCHLHLLLPERSPVLQTNKAVSCLKITNYCMVALERSTCNNQGWEFSLIISVNDYFFFEKVKQTIEYRKVVVHTQIFHSMLQTSIFLLSWYQNSGQILMPDFGSYPNARNSSYPHTRTTTGKTNRKKRQGGEIIFWGYWSNLTMSNM